MILSVSRRTDIPAFYTPWLMNRLREGYVLVRNPMNYHQVSRVSLDPKVIDCIVFWTKNAEPLLPYIAEIAARYPFYFQYTLNSYGRDTEPCLPPREDRIGTFRVLSDRIGADAVIWRYDPVLLTDRYTVERHIACFGETAAALRGSTRTCVFSFVDIYDKVKNSLRDSGARACTPEEMNTLAEAFARIAAENGMTLRTCAETVDLEKYGILHGCCIDGELIAKLTGWRLKAKKDPNQRAECGCLESVDIGQYNTCRHGCRYCYANFNPRSVAELSARHDPASPFLIGTAADGDRVTERKMRSLRDGVSGVWQLTMAEIGMA